MRPSGILVLSLGLLLVLLGAARAEEDEAWREGNPRNRRWTAPVLEYVERVADGTRVAHVRNPGPGVFTGGRLRGSASADVPDLAADAAVRVVLPASSSGVDEDGLTLVSAEGRVLDRIAPAPDALGVALLVERRTQAAGDRRFGSFVRRMRACFEDLHALFDDPDASTPRFLLAREPVRTRLRIAHVETYARDEAARPALFDDHPAFDLVIACDEGGPLAGFWLPAYSIGHNFLFRPVGDEAAPRRGLWSSWGEQALWHEVVHFRGVPDTYVFRIPPGALPGRTDEEVPLPEAYARGIMNHPYQEPRLAALTTAIVNAKHGVARVGACEEPDHEHGHMWRWVPEHLRLLVTKDGAPAAQARVRWWRSQPMDGLGDPRAQGIPADAVAAGEAATDAAGAVLLDGDLLGRGEPRPRRSLWLLVEIAMGGERRFEVLRLLELNEAWAAGHRDRYAWTLAWERLRPVERR